jgi:hypothetical protein
MANERAPADPLPSDFVPEGHAAIHRVSDGEDWASVADRYGVEVADLISFNFHTRNPEEIIWYLRRNVGCDTSRDGGLNWAFSSSADPGLIYVPPADAGEEPKGFEEETAADRWESAFQKPHPPPPDLTPDPIKSPELTPSYQQHAAEAREQSPKAPTGDEPSTQWAMRFRARVGPLASANFNLPGTGFGKKWSLLPEGKGNVQANVGAMVLCVDIMDRTTGAVGSFVLGGAEVSWGVSLPIDGELSTDKWKSFNTTEMSLNDFDKEFVRIPSGPFNFFKTFQFTWADVEYKDPVDSLLYGDGVDISDLGQGLPNPELSWGAGVLALTDLRWEPIDPWGGGFDPEAKRLDADVFQTAFEEGLEVFVEEMSKSQLSPESVSRVAHEFKEILDQQSSPEPFK